METKDIIFMAVLLIILAEVSYLLAKLPRSRGVKRGRMVLVDTSVLIDGRITAIARSGFIGDTLVIPRSVVGELQFLADNADADKRSRARHGLDVVTELQNMEQVEVELLQDGSKAREGVDERLLTLAKKHCGVICTIDFNLNKVAQVEGIQVLNVNELAQNLRMAYLPGEKLVIELVQKGQDSHQGVGYLPDGTMIVVEQASGMIGKIVEVEFIRSLQTAAGKMMFARIAGQKPAPKKEQQPAPKVSKNQVKQVKRDQPKQKPARQETHVEPQPQATFHSDQLKKQAPKPAQQRRQRPQQRRKVDHEAKLLDLVDKQ